MSDVVNLRLARKAKARAGAVAKASANRAAFGRTKAEKSADQAARVRDQRTLDGKKRAE